MSEDKEFKIDFVGIGGAKCATTWIYECLQEHPEICLAPKDQGQIALFFKEEPSQKEIKQYESFFLSRKVCKLKGDFHVNYLDDKRAAYRIKKHNPEAKIIVCLRNPIERAYSHYRYVGFSRNKKWESFEEALEKDPKILERGFYYKHLKKFFDIFPKENIIVLIQDDIKEDKLNFIQRIYRFLGVDTSFVPPSLNVKINITQFKLTKFGGFIHKGIIKPLLKNTKWAWKLKQSVLIKKAFCYFSERYSGKEKSIEPIKEITRKNLRHIYKQDIKSLEELINRSLSFWE